MNEATRQRRLQIEYERLAALTRVSSIFTFRSEGTPPTRYRLLYRGRGLVCPRRTEGAAVDFADEHAVELRLSSGFPVVPPELSWQTPVLHPNVAPSGQASLKDLGMQWHEQMPLDAVCEHVWDVIRLKVFDLERAVDFWARSWVKSQKLLELPVDQRSLRDLWRGGINVIPYERNRTATTVRRSIPAEVLYLSDETPEPTVPGLAAHEPIPPPIVGTARSPRPAWVFPPNAIGRATTDEVMYIGDSGEVVSRPPPVSKSDGERTVN